MKKLYSTSSLLVLAGVFVLMAFVPNKVSAQAEDLSGVYIDNIKVDSVTCWSFEKMNFVFSFNDKFKNYDKIEIEMHLMSSKGYEEAAFHIPFNQSSLNDVFGNAKYGVWKVLRDKNTDKLQSNQYTSFGWTYYERYNFHYTRFPEQSYSLVFVARGYKIEGYTIEPNGEKSIKYGESFALSKPLTIPVKRWSRPYEVDEYETKTVTKMGIEMEKKIKRDPEQIKKEKAYMLDYNKNVPCKIPGKSVVLKIEDAGGYREDLGVIK